MKSLFPNAKCYEFEKTGIDVMIANLFLRCQIPWPFLSQKSPTLTLVNVRKWAIDPQLPSVIVPCSAFSPLLRRSLQSPFKEATKYDRRFGTVSVYKRGREFSAQLRSVRRGCFFIAILFFFIFLSSYFSFLLSSLLFQQARKKLGC